MKKILSVLFWVFPWKLRRMLMVRLFQYRIHPSARIGFSVICPDYLEMAQGARIGNLTICKGLSLLKLGESALIGNLNWITGLPIRDKSFYADDHERRPQLIVDSHAAITNRHYIDCTDTVEIGKFTTMAGASSQILTHSVDLVQCRQASHPVKIGEYCFIGTGSILLAGSVLPGYSVLGAGSVLNKVYTERYVLYAGTPARPVKTLPANMGYFERTTGFVH